MPFEIPFDPIVSYFKTIIFHHGSSRKVNDARSKCAVGDMTKMAIKLMKTKNRNVFSFYTQKGLNNDNNLDAQIPEPKTKLVCSCAVVKSCAKRANHYSATVKTFFELVKVRLSSKLIKSLLLFCDNFNSKLVFFNQLKFHTKT